MSQRLCVLVRAAHQRHILTKNLILMSNRSRSLSSTSSFISPRNRLILLGIGVFWGTATCHKMYQDYKQEKVRKQLIQSQVYFDPDKREVVKGDAGSGSLIHPLDPDQLAKIRSIPVSCRFAGPTVIPGGIRFTLFQYTSCPFCCKVRALLEYYGISYDIIEVNPVLRQQLKVFPGYKKVPILVISREEDEDGGGGHSSDSQKKEKEKDDTFFIDAPLQINDSSLIVSLLASYFTCNPGLQDNLNQMSEMYPAVTFASLEENKALTEVVNKYFLMKGDHMDSEEYKRVIKGLSEERKWREWADNVLVHTLSPNVYRTLDEAIHTFETFSYMGDWDIHFPTWERLTVMYVGAFAMWLVGKRLKKRHGLKGDVRESLYDATKEWLTHVWKAGKGHDPRFAGGATPNLADLAVYGIYHSIEGTDAFSELLMHPQFSWKFKKWYTSMKEYVLLKKGSANLVQILKHRVRPE